MNLRNLIKLRKIELTQVKDRAYDNPCDKKLEIWHGPKDAPYHEAVCLTTLELRRLLDNIVTLQNQIKESLKDAEQAPKPGSD